MIEERHLEIVHFEQISLASHCIKCFAVEATIYTAIVDHNNYDRKIVSHHSLDFHAGKAKGWISLDTDDFLTGIVIPTKYGCCYSEARSNLWTFFACKSNKTKETIYNQLTPIVPKVPASNLCFGYWLRSMDRPMSIVFAPSLTIIASFGMISCRWWNTA